MNTIFLYFTDSVLRAPTIATMLMAVTAGIVGSILFLKKRLLIAEVMAHSAYPGVILGAIFARFIGVEEEYSLSFSLSVMLGALITAILALFLTELMQRSFNIFTDAAFCSILASFFGIGVTLVSYLQWEDPRAYIAAQTYLLGQSATMVDKHIFLYGALTLASILFITLFYKELKLLAFDRSYAFSLSMPTKSIEQAFFFLVALSVILGLRSVGVVLASAMLIAPPLAARQWTKGVASFIILSAIFGALSAFLGNYLSFELSHLLSDEQPLSFATGPMIVVVATVIALFSLLFAKERGIVLKTLRFVFFQLRCREENFLKTCWNKNALSISSSYSFLDLVTLTLLIRSGYMKKEAGLYVLTDDGNRRAKRVVRLHRLWELYLANYLGIAVQRVHLSAEEMEHVIDGELEQKLTLLLKDPKFDPHHKPIPPRVSF